MIAEKIFIHHDLQKHKIKQSLLAGDFKLGLINDLVFIYREK
jgi:hypothetical protein